MALFSKAIQFFNSKKKYFDAIFNIYKEFTKYNFRDKLNCFYHNEQVNKFIQSLISHKLKKILLLN